MPDDDLSIELQERLREVSPAMQKYLKAQERKKNRPPIPDGWTQMVDENKKLYTFDETGKSVCGAWRNKAHKYCTHPPINGRNRCYWHGGKSLRGLASPRYVNGTNSIDMPAQLAQRYQAALKDSELLSSRRDVALYEARTGELLSKLKEGYSGEFFKKTREVYRELVKSLRGDNQEESQRLMRELGAVIESGYSDERTWDNLQTTTEHKRKLRESERKRLIELKQMITTEELMFVIGGIMDSLKRHITDPSVLMNIANDMRRMLDDRGLNMQQHSS